MSYITGPDLPSNGLRLRPLVRPLVLLPFFNFNDDNDDDDDDDDDDNDIYTIFFNMFNNRVIFWRI